MLLQFLKTNKLAFVKNVVSLKVTIDAINGTAFFSVFRVVDFFFHSSCASNYQLQVSIISGGKNRANLDIDK